MGARWKADVSEERIGLNGGFDFLLVVLDFFGGPEVEGT
jgi:hypothetical protein